MHLGSWYFPSAKSSPVCSSAMLEGAAVPAHVTGLAVWALAKQKSGQLVILCEFTLVSLPPKLFNAPTYFHHWHVLWSSANLLLVCSWSARVSTNEAWQTVGMRKPNGACTIERIETLENRQAPWKSCDSVRKTKRWPRGDQEIPRVFFNEKAYGHFILSEKLWAWMAMNPALDSALVVRKVIVTLLRVSCKKQPNLVDLNGVVE